MDAANKNPIKGMRSDRDCLNTQATKNRYND